MDDLTSTYTSTTDLAPQSGVSWRTLMIAAAATLIGGGALGGWLMWEYGAPGETAAAAPAATAAPPVTAASPVAPPRPAAPAAPLVASEAGALATRIALLEDRLARITVSADGASGNAAKAESLLLALAARRALDRGLPLGVLEGQLRLRFGETQPVAVDAIIAAGATPMTEDDLRAGLVAIRGDLDTPDDANLLDRLRGTIDSLIVIRPSNSPSATPTNRYDRAIRALERGRIDLAIIEVEAMRGAGSAPVLAWLRSARLRNDAGRALDLIESAAILEPAAAAPVLVPTPAPVRRR